MPCSEFKWLNQKDIDGFDVNLIECNSVGYIFEINLEHCDELHELHNDYLLLPERLKISHSMMSKYCSNIANEYGIKIGSVNKLILNLGYKSEYVLHYRYYH